MNTFTETEMKDFQDYPIMPPDYFVTDQEKMKWLIPQVDYHIWVMIGDYKEIAERRDWLEEMPDVVEDNANQLNEDGVHEILNYETIMKDPRRFKFYIELDSFSLWTDGEFEEKCWEAQRNKVIPYAGCQGTRAWNYPIKLFKRFMSYKKAISAEKVDFFNTVMMPQLFKTLQRYGLDTTGHKMATFIHTRIISSEHWECDRAKDCEQYVNEKMHPYNKNSAKIFGRLGDAWAKACPVAFHGRVDDFIQTKWSWVGERSHVGGEFVYGTGPGTLHTTNSARR